MIISDPKNELSYAMKAINEYRAMTEVVTAGIKKDPRFMPEIKVKRIVDEKELGPITVEEW
jgi:hypothetical protein